MQTNKAGRKIFYADHSWDELESMDRSRVVLVLPSGSTEEHGPHLTMSSDSTAAREVARRAALEVENALVLPCLDYTPCLDTSNYTGTISIQTSHFIDFVCDIFTSLYRHGFRTLVVANVHGGAKTALDAAIREFHQRMGTAEKAYNDDFFIHMHNIYAPATDYLDSLAEGKDWGHAGEMETSLELHISPERVDMEKAVEDYIPWQPGFDWYIGDMSKVDKSGVHGDATKASAEKGAKICKALVAGLVEIIRKLLDQG